MLPTALVGGAGAGVVPPCHSQAEVRVRTTSSLVGIVVVLSIVLPEAVRGWPGGPQNCVGGSRPFERARRGEAPQGCDGG